MVAISLRVSRILGKDWAAELPPQAQATVTHALRSQAGLEFHAGFDSVKQVLLLSAPRPPPMSITPLLSRYLSAALMWLRLVIKTIGPTEGEQTHIPGIVANPLKICF